MPHQHDYAGEVREVDQKVGDEIVTFRQTFCTCGRMVENLPINRRPKDD